MAVTLWWISLGLAAAVTLVVGVLLYQVERTAEDILNGVAQIWTVGQKIANNTIHIALLDETNRHAARILDAAGGTLGASERIMTSLGVRPERLN
jgi:hypothetical protein